MFGKSRKWLTIAGGWILFSLFLSGCVSTTGEPAVIVGNATDSMLKSVVISGDGKDYEFAAVPANSESDGVRRAAKLASEVTIEWESASGSRGRKEVTLGKDVQEFDGNILFQVDRKGEVKVFMASEEDSEGSDLPWSLPASWEGSPSIPGMNM